MPEAAVPTAIAVTPSTSTATTAGELLLGAVLLLGHAWTLPGRRRVGHDGRVRLFVALRPSQEAVAHLAARLHDLGAAGPVPPPRWQPADPLAPHARPSSGRWPEDLGCLRLADPLARSAGRYECFRSPLRLSGAGCFGHRALWVGVTGAAGPGHGSGAAQAPAAGRIGPGRDAP